MTPFYEDDSITLWHGDTLDVLSTLPDQSVNCCVTSPPYYGLRDYGNDGQYGLEDSPAEYVERMRQVFAEVRRVLADDGTLWLNIGDSYSTRAATRKSSHQDGFFPDRPELRKSWRRDKAAGLTRMPADFGLPEKNLLGIPWMVARALQQPQYVGRIRSEADRAWLAAMVDGEGCIAIHRRLAGSSQYRKNDTYAPMVQVSNTCLQLLERCKSITGVGSISHSDRGRNRRIYRWCVMSNEARMLLREIYPHLVAKKPQARAAIAVPSSGADSHRAWLEVKAMNHGATHDGGWPTPQPLFDPGWILRNSVIWAKPNAMPESVTDRLSTRHELIFLFSKSRRYWFDLDAIREPIIWPEKTGHVFGGKNPEISRRRGAKYLPENRGTYRAADGEQHLGGHAQGRNPGDVWTIPTQPFPGAHFAVFPVEIPRRAIQAGCKPGGTVLDPFSGSGTTGYAAGQLGRRYVGIDLSAEYLDLSLRTRLAQTSLMDGESA